MGAWLYDPAEHRPLDARPWCETEARAAIEAIAVDALGAYQGPEQLWPNAADDLEGGPDVPYRGAYLGAAGVAWALDLLFREGLSPELPGLAELAATLPEGFRRAPELVDLAPPPAPSLLFGESGILLAVEAIRQTGEQLDELEACIRRNARNPAVEICWGSPGTMIAALELWRFTGQERWRELWLDSADWLLGEWRETVWVQDLYDEERRYTGAGHGFASNASVLLAGLDLLGDRGDEVTRRIRHTLRELAVRKDGLAQWFPVAGDETGRRPVQWCHGAPGIVTSLAGLPAEEETDRLLAAAGELTWRAGPLAKGVGLCHGTAGNAYAFLSLHSRTGDGLWLERARMFAMDAVADLERRREVNGRGRYTLFTGDIGVALLLRSCLAADPTFPFLGGALGPPAWPKPVSIQTARLRLEPLTLGHAEEAAPVLDDDRLHEYTGGRPDTVEQLRARYARQAAGHSADWMQGWLNWVIRVRETGTFAGVVQATLRDQDGIRTAEIAWVIASAHQRLGYAKEAAGGMADWLRENGTDRLVAHIHPEHRASIAVAKHLGLRSTDAIVDGEIRWTS